MKTYKIELRVNFQDKTRYDAILEIVRESARELLTTAMLLKDKREPRIAVQAGDLFMQDKEVMLFAESEGEKEDAEE